MPGAAHSFSTTKFGRKGSLLIATSAKSSQIQEQRLNRNERISNSDPIHYMTVSFGKRQKILPGPEASQPMRWDVGRLLEHFVPI